MSKENTENKLHIRVQRSQPYMALQEYTRQVIAAAEQGFVLTETIEDHARIFGAADFSVTLERKDPDAILSELVSEAQESGEYDNPVLAESVDIVPETGELPPNGNEDEGDDSVDIDFDSMKSKKELLEYAKAHGIDIPEDKKTVPAIRKYLKGL